MEFNKIQSPINENLSLSSSEEENYVLILCNVPRYISNYQLELLLKEYGKVKNIAKFKNANYYFIYFHTKKEMETVFEAINSSNPYNIVAKLTNKYPVGIKHNNNNENNQNVEENSFLEKKNSKISSHKSLILRSNIYLCEFCAKPTKWKCEDCLRRYCSKDCFTEDWPKHRYICQKKNLSNNNLPLLIRLDENISNNIKTRDIFKKLPPNNSYIEIVSVLKPYLLYGRFLKECDKVFFLKNNEIINNSWKTAKTLNKLPEKGDVLITKYNDFTVYRAIVLNPINDNKIIIKYIDFGNVEKKSLSELKEAPNEVLNLKCYSFCIYLKDIPPNYELTPNLKAYLGSFVNNNNVKLKLTYDENENFNNFTKIVNAIILDASKNEIINEKILELYKNEEDFLNNSESLFYMKDIIYKTWQEATNVAVLVTDNSLLNTGKFSCISFADVVSLQNLSTNLKIYAEAIREPYKPKEKEVCVVQYNDEWCRGICVQINQDRFTFFFLDYGYTCTANCDEIRKYPNDFQNETCDTVSCIIDGFPKQSNERLVNKLKNLIQTNSKLVIEEITNKRKDDCVMIRLPKIMNILKKENLI